MDYNSVGDFANLTNLLVSNIQQISHNVNLLQRLVDKLGSTEDSVVLRSELHELQQKTNKLAKDSNDYIKQLSTLTQSSDSTEAQERKLINVRNRNQFLEVLTIFQRIQRTASEKEKANIIKQTKTPIKNPFYINDETTFGPTDNLSQSPAMLQIEEEEQEKNNLQLVRDQHLAIKRLESDIVDVNQIFQDLGRMVHEQQDLVDNIENNMEGAQIQLETGNQELQRAAEYQRRARKKKLLIVIIFVIFLTALALILYFSLNKS